MKYRVVIIGGGFVGTLTARMVATRQLPETEVILMSQSDHFLFAPLLIESLAGDLHKEDCTRTLRPWADTHHMRFIQGKTLRVQREERVLHYQDAFSHLEETLSYDTLVFAQGGTTNFFHTPGAEDFAFALKTYADVEALHARIKERVAQAQAITNTDEQRALLEMGVVGGGPAGIEAIGSLRRYTRAYVTKEAPALLPLLSFFVVEASPDILPGFPQRLRHLTKKELAEQGILLYLGEAVTHVSERSITTTVRTLSASLVLWAAGVTPNLISISPPFLEAGPSGLPLLKETLFIDAHHLSAGDVATLEWSGQRLPKNGQLAMQTAYHLAETIIATRTHKKIPRFAPHLKGLFLSLGSVGFLSIGPIVWKSSLIPLLRQWLYRFRMWQIL